MSLFQIILTISMVLLSFCMILILIRFIIGPSLPDRISAFDLLSANIIALIAIYSELTDNESFIDIAIILSLFTFLSAISFAYYLLKK